MVDLKYDVLIVGSGPAGAQAASALVDAGKKVALIDIGFRDEKYSPVISNRPFRELQHEKDSAFFFLGASPEANLRNQHRAGAHLTPPRQHMIHRTEELFPVDSPDFYALNSTSQGGLGTSWGANCFSFSKRQLDLCNLPPLTEFYNAVAENIGVSGDPHSDISHITEFFPLQKPLALDQNAVTILSRYEKIRNSFARRWFKLGVSPLASISQSLGNRAANPYHDMDFWSDATKTVYRPQWTIDVLRDRPNFEYLTERLAERVESVGHGVTIWTRGVNNDHKESFQARKVLIACGAIGSCRLVANSLGSDGPPRYPILCNPNQWIAAINLKMLGRTARDRRHSLAQLTAIMPLGDGHDELVGQFYSYRSLLMYRLLREIPVPTFISRPIVRLIITSLTLINLHYSDDLNSEQYAERTREGTFKIHFKRDPAKLKTERKQRQQFLRGLWRLFVIPLRIQTPQNGASIHYAGTLSHITDADGRITGLPNVFAIDASTWHFLPARGLTFTIMANARRISGLVAKELSS